MWRRRYGTLFYRMKIRFVHTVLLALLCLPGLQACAERLSLRGGSVITAPIVRQDEKAFILDLGHDLLRIPASEVIAVAADDTDTAVDPVSQGTGLYLAAGADRVTTASAAGKYGEAVVVVKTPGGLGSGFFVNTNGYLLTNFHVIRGEKHITVTSFRQSKDVLRRVVHKDVEIVATAPFHDLAVLRVRDAGSDLTPVIFAPNDNVAAGETVFVIGNPLGLERSVTEGVISQTERKLGGILYHQIDAPVNPGNSGGPLFNGRGQVIGVVNMQVPTMQGLNFAIPAMHAKYVLDHLAGFAYDQTNPVTGYVYPDPPSRPGADRTENENEEK